LIPEKKTMRPIRTFLALALVTAPCGVAAADVLVTTDGSRIVGKIGSWYEGKVTIVTDIAGALTIDVAKIVSFGIADDAVLQLQSGDRLVGKVVEGEAYKATVQTQLGFIPIETTDVQAAWRPDEKSPEVLAVEKQLEETRLAYIPKWNLTVEGGAVMKEGNTDSLRGMGRADLSRTTPKDLLNFYARVAYGEVDDVRDQNEYIAGAKYEYNMTERWFWYLRSEFEFDEFENLDLRATAAGGIGYYWIRSKQQDLKTRVGAGYRHETFDDGTSDDAAIVDLGLDYRADIFPWAQFLHSTTYSPDVEDFDDYRLALDTAMLIPLRAHEWKLKLGVINQYDSKPQPGVERLDNTYYANILVELK
jgi:putative salt-induced outer membrane protein YdiY